jgi:hypothetical protein
MAASQSEKSLFQSGSEKVSKNPATGVSNNHMQTPSPFVALAIAEARTTGAKELIYRELRRSR